MSPSLSLLLQSLESTRERDRNDPPFGNTRDRTGTVLTSKNLSKGATRSVTPARTTQEDDVGAVSAVMGGGRRARKSVNYALPKLNTYVSLPPALSLSFRGFLLRL